MVKKQKKQSKYIFRNKEFTTFKAMKAFIWYNSHTDEEMQGFEIIDDEIQKHYIFIKKERRLLCSIIYNKEEVYKEWYRHLQLELFNNEQKNHL